MDERHVARGAGPGQGFRAAGVDRIGQIRLALGLVDGRVGRGVEHQVDLVRRLNRARQGRGIGQVDVGARQRPHFDVAILAVEHLARQLAGRPELQDAQRHAFTRPSRSDLEAALAEPSIQSRLSTYQRTVSSMPTSSGRVGAQPSSRSSFEESME